MNCEKIKEKVSIRTVLESFNLLPAKENRKMAFYFALDREEKIPSLSVDFVKNKAFDFGTGKSYDVISIVQQINKCSVSDALKYLNTLVSSGQMTSSESKGSWQDISYEITKVGPIEHPALLEYLKYRMVSMQRSLVKEIHYRLKSKNLFGIGFKNDSGGFEVRNKYTKICLGKKDITLIKNDTHITNEIIVFEGFFDYLTYMTMVRDSESDFLILNSTAMLFKVGDKLKDYKSISLFLDNDANGRATTEIFHQHYNKVEDCSSLYKRYKDLNEWFRNADKKI